MKKEREVFNLYELANDVLRKQGHEKPEELSDEERFDGVLKHLLLVKPKEGK